MHLQQPPDPPPSMHPPPSPTPIFNPKGAMDGMTYAEIAQKFPMDFEARKKDKLQYRWGACIGGAGWGGVVCV